MGLKYKNAFFFTSIAVLVLSLLMLSIKPLPSNIDADRIPIIEERVLFVNDYVRELSFDYIPKAILVSSRSAFRVYSNYLIRESKFENNTTMKSNIYSLMLYGNLSTNPQIINNNTLINILNNVSLTINETFNINTNFNYSNISYFSIYQDNTTGPWRIGVNYSLNYSVSSDLANWSTETANYSIFIYVLDLPDAYLSINSDKNINIRNITQAPNITWNYNLFKDHIGNKTYAWSSVSPKFLSRLINDTTDSSCCGIHTFIDKDQTLIGDDIGFFYNRSFVDYCYFKNECTGLHTVNGITSSDGTYPLRIDSFHVGIYGIELNSTQLE